MSIASELNNLSTNILNAYDAVETKGGTIPTNKNMVNLPTAIESISAGGSFVGIPREVSSEGIYQMPADNFTFSLPSNATDIDAYALYYAFYGCTHLTSVNLSSLTRVTSSNALGNAFYGCTHLTSVDLSSLTTVTGSSALSNAFNGCTSLTSVDLSSLTTVSGGNAFYYAFRDCASLTSVSFPVLTTVDGAGALQSAFGYCTSLASVSFPALTTSSFGSRNNQFSNMLIRCSGVTVHFPASVQSTIGNWTSVQNGFGGTNTTVLFDL